MSFRIDDILKQNSSKEAVDKPPNTNPDNSEVNSICTPNCTSILEYTLTNNYYYKNTVQQEMSNKKFSTNYEAETSYRDLCFPKVSDGRCSYSRDPDVWTTYMPFPMMLNCSHLHTRRKGGQIRFTTNQTEELEKQFISHKYLSPEDRRQLANFLRLSDRQVKTWFQNRRAKWRRNNQLCSSRTTDIIINNVSGASLTDVSTPRISYQ